MIKSIGLMNGVRDSVAEALIAQELAVNGGARHKVKYAATALKKGDPSCAN